MISAELSVLPPSITKYSRFGYPCMITERMVSSMYFPWLKEGVTILIFGQGLPFAIVGGNFSFSSFQTQRLLLIFSFYSLKFLHTRPDRLRFVFESGSDQSRRPPHYDRAQHGYQDHSSVRSSPWRRKSRPRIPPTHRWLPLFRND